VHIVEFYYIDPTNVHLLGNYIKIFTSQFPTTRLESTTEYGLLSYEHIEGMVRAERNSLS